MMHWTIPMVLQVRPLIRCLVFLIHDKLLKMFLNFGIEAFKRR